MCAEFIGRRVNFGIARESTRGTFLGSFTYWLPRTELSFQDKAMKVISGEAHGHIDDATDAFLTEKYGEGSISAEVRDKSFGLFVYAILGSLSTVNNGGDYTHTFTEANSNQHQSLSFGIDDPNADDSYFTLAMLNSLTINVETGQLATFEAEFQSRAGDDGTFTATYSAENRFVSHLVNMRLATAVGTLAAASDLPIKSFSITFTKNLVRDHNFGTIQPTEIHNQQFMVEGSFTLNNESNVYRDYMIDNTYRALRLGMVNTDVTLSAGNNPTVQIDLSRCHFFEWERNNGLDEIAGQTINFKGLKDITNSLNIVNQIVVINEASSY